MFDLKTKTKTPQLTMEEYIVGGEEMVFFSLTYNIPRP